MKNNKILFVTTHFLPDYHYGGVVESGSKLLKYLRKKNKDIRLIGVSKTPKESAFFLENGDIICKSFFLHSWGFSISLIWKLFIAVKECDKVYINGIVTFPTTLAQFYAIILKKPFINSIRGGLEDWRVNHKSWKKKPYIYLVSLPLLRIANRIHVTAIEEEKSLQRFGLFQTFVSSNGIDTEIFNILPERRTYTDNFGKRKFMFLFLSRTDKEKGIDILLQAYSLFCKKYEVSHHQLIIAGPDNQGYLEGLNINFNMRNIIYLGGIYNEYKIKLLRKADVFVFPSYSENFGNVIVESLACETPVITTTGTPWREIENENCGIYINPNPEELFKSLEKMFLMDDDKRTTMGKNGRNYVMSAFSWTEKSKEVQKELYQL